MKTFKLTIKPASKGKESAFDFCKDNGLVGIGWSAAYEEAVPDGTKKSAQNLLENKWGKVPPQVKYFLNRPKVSDHIWLQKNGQYYLCKVTSPPIFINQLPQYKVSKLRDLDLGHFYRANWVTIPRKYVLGSVQRGVIARRTIQAIKLKPYEYQYNDWLFRKFEREESVEQCFNLDAATQQLKALDVTQFFSILNDMEVEDLVSAYVQITRKAVLLKSSTFKSNPDIEFQLNAKDKTIFVSVKSGQTIQLKPENFTKYLDGNTEVVLFSSATHPYVGDAIDGVCPLNKNDLFEWIKINIWALSQPCLMKILLLREATK
ncbi:MAG: hypothetical protein HWE10_05895 [Gammaproteobacteria bacterium]|nr:hypothetical protein [Gammaproteobacteria bacterium]